MDTVLNIDANVMVAFKFFWRHEFDAHGLRAIGNRCHELKVARLRNRRVAETLECFGQLKRFFSQSDHVENKVDILCAAGFFDCEFHGLRACNHEVVSCRAEGGQEFENVGPLWFGNHADVQRGAMALSNRRSACFRSRPPLAYKSKYACMFETVGKRESR